MNGVNTGSKGDIVEESLITDENGKVASKELPLGKYKVEEVGAFDRETGKEIPDYKYHIIDGEYFKEITLSAAAQSVKVVYGDVSIRNDGIPEITTSARDFTTGTGEGEYSESAKIIDTVSFKKLEPGKGYTLVGKLMDKATGEPILIDGKEAIGEKTFTAKEYDGNIMHENTGIVNELNMKGILARHIGMYTMPSFFSPWLEWKSTPSSYKPEEGKYHINIRNREKK